MYHRIQITTCLIGVLLAGLVHAADAPMTVVDTDEQKITLKAGHPSLAKWRLPAAQPSPADNKPSPSKISLGKKLFFDPRLSGDGNMSCASCHSPMFGWSDGLATSRGAKGVLLDRASPTIFNAGFNSLQMWDGRKKTLEDQAMGPMQAHAEMNMDIEKLFSFLNKNEAYVKLFNSAFPGKPIDAAALSKALATFERTIVSNSSPFDQWVAGKASAMTANQIKGFALFIDPKKANCSACHAGAAFTDSSFHNLGLASFGKENPDLGRFTEKPLPSMKGAFKTPTVREVSNTAPYFHDGSANTLAEVIEFYVKGGLVKTNLSKSMHVLQLDDKEKAQLLEFLGALSSPQKPFVLPILPN